MMEANILYGEDFAEYLAQQERDLEAVVEAALN